MPVTEPIVTMHLTDATALSDSTPTTVDNSSFANISGLKTPHDYYPLFMTLEHNINILDGSLIAFNQSDLSLSYFSNTLSSNDCTSSSTITINFSNTHIIPGIVLYFGDIRAVDKITLTYLYNNSALSSSEFYPDKDEYRVNSGSINFNKIIINFNTTKFPGMFNRLQYIEYGFKYVWNKDNIISATINEEINPISSVVPINTCELTIYDGSNEFNILNKEGVYKYLRPEDKFDVSGVIDGTTYNFGSFYLDTWSGNKPYEIQFNLISPIGLLDKKKYFNGGIIDVKSSVIPTAYDILKSVLDDAGLKINETYTISEDLKDTPILGELPIRTYREIIQLVAFTAKACIDDTRDGIIKIYRQSEAIQNTFPPDILFDPIQLTLSEPVTSITVKTHTYDVPMQESEYENIFEGNLTKNITLRITTDKPIFDVRYKKATGTSYTPYTKFTSGKYYFDFTPDETTGYTIQVSSFKDTEQTYIHNISYPDKAYEPKENVISIDNVTTIFNDCNYFGVEDVKGNIKSFVSNLEKYYVDNTIKIECETIYSEEIKTGTKCSLWVEFNQYCIGTITKQRINLSGGFISNMTIIAQDDNLTAYYFATNGVAHDGTTGQYDLMSNDNFLI